MPSVYDLKPRFQLMLRPTMRALAARGWTPNQITLVALAGSATVGALLLGARVFEPLLLLVPLWMFARMALNAIDGMMARELNMQSKLGMWLNEGGDIVSDLLLYLPLASYEGSARAAVSAFAIGAVLTELCGLMGPLVGGRRGYHGPMGKSDRAFAVSIIAIVTVLLPLVHLFWFVAFWGLTALEGVTCLNRLRAAVTDAAKSP